MWFERMLYICPSVNAFQRGHFLFYSGLELWMVVCSVALWVNTVFQHDRSQLSVYRVPVGTR